MDKSEIDAARAQAGQIVVILKPLIDAMNGAGAVLSILSNAKKHKTALESEVDTLVASRDKLQEEVDALKSQMAEAQAAAAKADADARAQARDAAANAARAVAAAEAAAQERIAAAAAKAQEKEQAFTDAVMVSQQDHDKKMADMFSQQQEASESVDAYEARLAELREKAKIFAASLTG